MNLELLAIVWVIGAAVELMRNIAWAMQDPANRSFGPIGWFAVVLVVAVVWPLTLGLGLLGKLLRP